MKNLLLYTVLSVLLGTGFIIGDVDTDDVVDTNIDIQSNQYSPEKAKIWANGEISTLFYGVEPDDYYQMIIEGKMAFMPSQCLGESIDFLLNGLLPPTEQVDFEFNFDHEKEFEKMQSIFAEDEVSDEVREFALRIISNYYPLIQYEVVDVEQNSEVVPLLSNSTGESKDVIWSTVWTEIQPLNIFDIFTRDELDEIWASCDEADRYNEYFHKVLTLLSARDSEPSYLNTISYPVSVVYYVEQNFYRRYLQTEQHHSAASYYANYNLIRTMINFDVIQ